MTRIAFAGDWHGDDDWASRALDMLQELEISEVYHVGDFGVWPDDHQLMSSIERQATQADRADIHLFVTPGNHEWWPRLDELFEETAEGFIVYSDHVTILAPGHRWERHGLSWLSLGGAGSIDLEYRTEGKDWWPSEDITEADVNRAVQGGVVDVLISHQVGYECTLAVTQQRANPGEYGARAIVYSRLAEQKVQQVVDAVRPRIHVHGHWHVQDEAVLADGRRVYSMAKEWQPGNLALLDTETLAWQWVHYD